MISTGAAAPLGWRGRLPAGVRPYFEAAPLAAAFLGISSGFAFAMIGATLTTRLAQYGIRKSAVTAFALTFLAYNFKFLWAPLVDNVRLPILGGFGQRRSWLWFVGALVMGAVVFLGSVDPTTALPTVATAAILVGVAGATFDIVIDAYRIELLEPRQLGVGSGMSVRLADRCRVCRSRRAGRCRAVRVVGRVCRLCALRSAGDARCHRDG
jgi:PAT family beta-lactamase induction signal transducer AmpG